MKKQKVVRTYPNNYTYTTHTTDLLEEVLNEGYCVVMCNKITFKGNTEILEYIVEKEEEKVKCQYTMI